MPNRSELKKEKGVRSSLKGISRVIRQNKRSEAEARHEATTYHIRGLCSCASSVVSRVNAAVAHRKPI